MSVHERWMRVNILHMWKDMLYMYSVCVCVCVCVCVGGWVDIQSESSIKYL